MAAMHRFVGSIGFVAVARAAFMVTRDADDAERRLFLPVKNNLAPLGKGLAFRLQQSLVGPERSGIVASSVVWESAPVSISADEALRATDAPGEDDDMSRRREAEDFLREILADGATLQASEVKRQAVERLISIATLRRAKDAVGVRVSRNGFGPGSVVMWSLCPSTDSPTSAEP
jgi:putative DNA primase/helicase